MHEMTLRGLLNLGESDYVRNDANYMAIEVQFENGAIELIINSKDNFKSKLAYYEKAYNENLTLKANPSIKIVHYDFFENMLEYFQDMGWGK